MDTTTATLQQELMQQVLTEYPKVLSDSRIAFSQLASGVLNPIVGQDATDEEDIELSLINTILYPFWWTITWVWRNSGLESLWWTTVTMTQTLLVAALIS